MLGVSRRRIASLRINATILRFNSSYAYIHEYKPLKEKIQNTINSDSTDQEIVGALKSIKNLQASYPIQDQLDETSKLSKESLSIINEVFKPERKEFSTSLLHDIFTLNLPTLLNLKIIDYFYKSNPQGIISKEIALIPLRNALFNADFQRAIKITDLTVAHENYINNMGDYFRKGLIKLGITAAGITVFTKFGVTSMIDAGMISQSWEGISTVNTIFVTYLLNSSFFITIVKLGRTLINAGGDYLTWQKGTFYNHWFKHADEMLFSSKIIEADRELNQGENTPEIVEELCRPPSDDREAMKSMKPGVDRYGNRIRLLTMKDNMDKLKFQAYWMTGGDGFEWTEPDQDPAELEWKQHLELYNKPALRQSEAGQLGWADDLIEKSDEK